MEQQKILGAKDYYGHGTHVTGIIASQHSTYKGVAYNADIYVVKVLNSSNAGDPYLIWDNIGDAMDWCRINKNADIISISIGTKGTVYNAENCLTDLDEKINDAYNAGIPVIISSGNEGSSLGINYPACSPNALSVGATTKNDGMAFFTNRKVGLLDVLAPGYDIRSLRWNPNGQMLGCTATGDLMKCSGTSQAAPHVSGATALLLEANPDLTPTELETLLKTSGYNISGYPRIDVLSAFDSICDIDGDSHLDESCSGGDDCDDSDGGVYPGAIEICDGVDNDCDSTIDEGGACTQDCTEAGYSQCVEYSAEDCDVSIAVDYYTNTNGIEWGEVNDSWDPYVIGEYKVAWKGIISKQMYYDVNDPYNDCEYGGCSGENLTYAGIKVTVTAPGTATTENILGYNDTESTACWAWFNGFNPSYGNDNPIYVLNCFNDDDCVDGYCDKSGAWNTWDCVAQSSDGQFCTYDYECLSNYCDNDSVGLSDDNHCFTPYNTYFDGQETSYCEFSTSYGVEECDERQVDDDLNKCMGYSYYEEECSSSCSYQDITSRFECDETDCSCTEPLCDGLSSGDNLTICSSEQTYFADSCNLTAGGEDRDMICRSSAFDATCTADSECNGVVAGTANCNLSCSPADNPPLVILETPDNNAVITSGNATFNCTVTDYYGLVNITLYHNLSGNWEPNLTKNLTGTSGSLYFTLSNIPDGDYQWNCLAYDNASQLDWGDTNYTLIMNRGIDVLDLEELYSNYTSRIFEFKIKNYLNFTLKNITWQIDMDDDGVVINSTKDFSLDENEHILVFTKYDFTNKGFHNINITATSGEYSKSVNLTIFINSPKVSSISLTPETPFTNNDLNCSFIATSSDGNEAFDASVYWYLNDSLFLNYNLSIMNDTLVSTYLDYPNTTKYEDWICSIHPFDTTGYGSPTNISVTIENSIPSIPTLSLLANGTETQNATLFFNWTISTDLDNDAMNYEIIIDEEDSFTLPYILNNSTLTNNYYATSDLNDGTYYWKVRAITDDANSNYTDYRVFTLEITLPNDTYKFAITNTSEAIVAWFGDEGNLVLKGSCSVTTCNAPANSFILKDSIDDTIAYIDSEGNLCLEAGSCSGYSANCDSPGDGSFIIRNETDVNVGYIDSTGNLCLIGGLYQNADL